MKTAKAAYPLVGRRVRIMGQGYGTILQVSTWGTVNSKADIDSTCYLVRPEEQSGSSWIGQGFAKLVKGKKGSGQ